MKLLLSLTLLWALCSTGGALVCQTCINRPCTDQVQVTCPSADMCITASIQASSSWASEQLVIKQCAPSSLCPATGFETFSVNFGGWSALASALCCNTDNCNSATQPFPVVGSVNGLQCATCYLVSQCTGLVQCRGTEDHCFQASVTSGSNNIPLLGCASANTCAEASELGSLLSLQSVNITCCDTNLCNSPTVVMTTTAATTPTISTSATTTTAASGACCIRLGMIHLLIGLLVFTLY